MLPGPSQPLVARARPRLDFLETIRFIAAFNVTFFWHFPGPPGAPDVVCSGGSAFGPFPEPSYGYRELAFINQSLKAVGGQYTPLIMFMNGGYNVHIFFVPSAICLTAKTFTTGDGKHLQMQMDKRILRLVPPCVLVILVFEAAQHFSPYVWQQPAIWTKVGGPTGGIFQIFNKFVPLWTLLFEVPAPMYLWLMYTLDSPKPRQKLVLMCMFCIVPLFLASWTYPFAIFGFGFYLSQSYFGVGGMPRLADIGATWTGSSMIWTSVFLSHVLTGFMMNPSCCYKLSWCQVPMVPSSFLLMMALCASPFLQKILMTGGFHNLGKYTFMLYITHVATWACLYPISQWLRDAGYWQAGLLLTMTMTFLTSIVFYYVADQPSIRAGEAYAKWKNGEDMRKINWCSPPAASESPPAASK